MTNATVPATTYGATKPAKRTAEGHPYIAVGVDRHKLVAKVAIAAVPAAAGLNVLATRFAGDAALVAASPSAILVFGIAFWLYDSRLWRASPLGVRLSRIPDLAGTWVGTVTLRSPDCPEEGHEAITCEMHISQSWSHMSILFETDRNYSQSLSAVVAPSGSGFAGVHYHYRVSWKDASQSNHTGFQELTPHLNDWKHLRGQFFTDRHFRRFGEVDIRKVATS